MKYAALAAFTLAAVLAGNAQAAEMTKADMCIQNAIERIGKNAFEAMGPSIPDYADASYDIVGNELQAVFAACETPVNGKAAFFAGKDKLTVDRITLDTVRIRP